MALMVTLTDRMLPRHPPNDREKNKNRYKRGALVYREQKTRTFPGK